MSPPPTVDHRRCHFTREQIERVARIYSSNIEAGRALGIAAGSFGRLARRFGVETPQARRNREQRERQRAREVAG